jgi:hypothetical protein
MTVILSVNSENSTSKGDLAYWCETALLVRFGTNASRPQESAHHVRCRGVDPLRRGRALVPILSAGRPPHVALSGSPVSSRQQSLSHQRDAAGPGRQGWLACAPAAHRLSPCRSSKTGVVLVAAPAHPLAGRHASPVQLAQTRLLVREAGSATRPVALEALARCGVDTRAAVDFGSNAAVRTAVLQIRRGRIIPSGGCGRSHGRPVGPGAPEGLALPATFLHHSSL